MTELKRLHSLDAARGIAALAVVVWHWQHMYLIGGGKLTDRTIQPFYDLLFPLYQYGWLAVEFFFTLSGFVFFWLYGQAISQKSLSLGKFWLARFSRLYPLHFITLIVIAVLQVNLMANGHDSFVYGGTTWPNFTLNLLFLQYFIPGWTFNGPEWSVGVEILLYVLFCLYCRLLRPHWIVPLLGAVVVGLWVMQTQWALGRGIIGFFAGGVVYEAWRRLRDRQWMPSLVAPIFGLTVVLWLYAIVEAKYHPLTSWLNSFGMIGWWWVEMGFRLGLVPLTVFALALHEGHGAKFWQKLSPIGDLTYALYLWHFPLQLAIASAVMLGGLPLAPIQSPFGFLAFFAVLIAISIASYRWIERPAQSWIRDRFSPRRASVEDPA
ncbi:peptidoglycan/LPS O-acetylase OafA/YrhL [Devosia sp. UYZn731]|uniref:acyltransferase family protein n=1 Tax=Devosia sp. UYZn731 TaxID=3156345 RepID=UPI003392A8A9